MKGRGMHQGPRPNPFHGPGMYNQGFNPQQQMMFQQRQPMGAWQGGMNRNPHMMPGAGGFQRPQPNMYAPPMNPLAQTRGPDPTRVLSQSVRPPAPGPMSRGGPP